MFIVCSSKTLLFAADTFHRHFGTEQPHPEFKTQKVSWRFVPTFSWYDSESTTTLNKRSSETHSSCTC